MTPEKGRRHEWVRETVLRQRSAVRAKVATQLASESNATLTALVVASSRRIARSVGCRIESAQVAIDHLVGSGAIAVVSRDARSTATVRLVPAWWESGSDRSGNRIDPVDRIDPVSDTNRSGFEQSDRSGFVSRDLSSDSESSDSIQNPPDSQLHGTDLSDSDDRSEPWDADPFDVLPADVLATLAEAQAPVQLPPSAPARISDPPQVPPPPPATQPAPVAMVTQPTLPALSAPAVATDSPAVERKRAAKPRKSKPGVDGAGDAARGVMDAWDAAWANAFRRPWQRCAEGCDGVGKSRCATHFPGYAWAKREVFQVRAALTSGGWTADRLVRLMPYYHRQLDGKDIPRTVGAFLRAASTIEARNPAPRIVPAHTPAPAPAPVAPLTPAEPYNPLRDQSIPRGERLRMLGLANPWGPRVSGDVQ